VAENDGAGAECGAGGRGAGSGGYKNRLERGAAFSPLTCSDSVGHKPSSDTCY